MPVSTRPCDYSDGDVALHGLLVLDDSVTWELPGILLVHGGAGLDQHTRTQAERYASLGYVVFACDMYGEGVAGNLERVMAVLTELRADPGRLAQRALAGLEVLRGRPEVTGECAAVGFCFGGLTVLTLAREGADLLGVVSVHGSLATVRPARPGLVRARVLACHGALDPHVPMTDVVAFGEEMTQAGADWQLNIYGGAVHGFTHADAVPGATPGVEYHAETDRRSFADISFFLADVLVG
jgi:dienelactone hydrolase